MHELAIAGLTLLLVGVLGMLAVRRFTRSMRRWLAHAGAIGYRRTRQSARALDGRRPDLLAWTTRSALLSWPVRAQLRRAVATAGYAVRAAEHEGAAVGDLPRLVRELAAMSRVQDARLRAGATSAGGTSAGGTSAGGTSAAGTGADGAAEVLALANAVRAAADDALAALGEARYRHLPHDVADATAGVRAGAAWLRAGGR